MDRNVSAAKNKRVVSVVLHRGPFHRNRAAPKGNSMRVLRSLALVVLGLGWPASLEADILVTLATHDLEGQPVASDALTPGDVVAVDILLAVDGDDLPLADVRLIQFDFSSTSPNIIIDQFEWRLDPGLGDSTYLQFSDLHQPSAVYLGQGRPPGVIIDLVETPVGVAER